MTKGQYISEWWQWPIEFSKYGIDISLVLVKDIRHDILLYLGWEPNLVQHKKKSTWTWTSMVSLPAEPQWQKTHLSSPGMCTWVVTEWSFHAAFITLQGALNVGLKKTSRDLTIWRVNGFWNGYSIARMVDGCSKCLQVRLFPVDIDFAMGDDFIGLRKIPGCFLRIK